MSNPKVYFKNLDSIRFIAASMVFVAHAISPSYQYLPIKNTVWERLLNTISNGGTGVSIFFVLSGFLITYLLINEHELNGKISVKKFYLRRILRIWPLYFLVIIFTFLIYPFAKSLMGVNNPLASNLWYHVFFLSNFDVINIARYSMGNDAMSQNITWSVSIEEQFYLFWPLLFILLPKRFWIYSMVLVVIVSILFRIINSHDDLVLYFHTISVLLDLGIGGLIACLIKQNKNVRTIFENSSTLAHVLLFSLSFCLLFWSDIFFSSEYGHAIGRIFISISFGLIIGAQAMTKNDSILNLSNFSFASKRGRYTYGMYLLHPIAITFVDVARRLLDVKNTNFTSLFCLGLISFAVTMILSKASFKYFEARFLLYKESFATTKRLKSEEVRPNGIDMEFNFDPSKMIR